MINYGREKSLIWKRDVTEKFEKIVLKIVVENIDFVDKFIGWRFVVMEIGIEKKIVNFRRCESVRVENKNNIDVIVKFLFNF